MTRGRIVSVIKIAPQFLSVMSDFGFIVPDVASITPSVVGKHRSCTQPNQQKYPSNGPFHISTSLQFRLLLVNGNTARRMELRYGIS